MNTEEQIILEIHFILFQLKKNVKLYLMYAVHDLFFS